METYDDGESLRRGETDEGRDREKEEKESGIDQGQKSMSSLSG